MTMSQKSFLEDITHWSHEDCLHNFDKALPKLICRIFASDSTEVVDILKVMCQCFLPVCPLQQLESKVFSKVKKKIIDTSSNLLTEVTEVIKSKQHSVDEMVVQISKLLQIYLEMLDIIDVFVSHVKQSDKEIKLQYVQSLPSLVIEILNDLYSHCKGSSHMYGDLLKQFTELLSTLFKKAYALQMNFLSILDQLHFSASSDRDVTELCEIILGLHQLSVIAVSLDVKVMIVLWKTISRLSCQYKDALMNQLEVDRMLLSLAEDMKSSLNYQIQIVTSSNEQEEKTFTKTMKVLGFQMKVLVAIVKEYECVLSECIGGIVSLMLTVQSSLPPSLKNRMMTRDQQTEIYSHLGVALEPLISYLIPNINFIMALTKVKKAEKEISDWSALCMVFITIIKLLPNYSADTQTVWINPKLYPEDEIRNPILKEIFNTIPHCYAELCHPAHLPSIMCKGQPQRSVTLYHHLYAHLCVFVALLPAVHFPVLEDCLLENVFSLNVHNTLLAADLWCFVVRYGSAALCRDHCALLARLIQKVESLDSKWCCHLVNTLRRLTKFMAPEHVSWFLHEFPVESNFPVYSAIAFSAFSKSQLQEVTVQLLTSCTAVIKSWIQNCTPRLSDAHELVYVFRVLCNLYSTRSIQIMDREQHQTLLNHSITCMLSLPCTTCTQYVSVQLIAAGVLEFLAYNIEDLDNTALYKVLSEVIGWLRCDQLNAIIKVTVAYFLCSLGKKVFAPDNLQVAILRIIPRMFSILLADSNPVVQQMSLENFAQFAEETPHETIVPESLQQDEQIQTRVVSYLSLLSRGQTTNSINYSLLKSYQQILDKNLKPSAQGLPSSPVEQPPNKKCKLDPLQGKINKQVNEALQLLEDGTRQLETVLSQTDNLPQTRVSKIHNIQSRLADLLNK